MESQNKSSSNGVPREISGANYANKRKLRGWEFALRFLALALSLTAAVLLGVNKQTTTVKITILSILPPAEVPVTAKSQYLSSFMFFVAANSTATAYAALSLVLSLAHGGGKNLISAAVVLSDLVMVALLNSAVGAAGAIGVLGYQGNSHVRWNKVCNHFGEFCQRSAIAIGISGVAAFAFFLLVLLNIHKKGKEEK